MAANAKTAEAPRRSPGQMLGTMGRVLGYMVKRYKFSCLMVVVCILGSALASVQGILFTQTLIDGYIAPMLQSGAADYGPLAAALLRVAGPELLCSLVCSLPVYWVGRVCCRGYGRIYHE